jgi:hypothetical protein
MYVADMVTAAQVKDRSFRNVGSRPWRMRNTLVEHSKFGHSSALKTGSRVIIGASNGAIRTPTEARETHRDRLAGLAGSGR